MNPEPLLGIPPDLFFQQPRVVLRIGENLFLGNLALG